MSERILLTSALSPQKLKEALFGARDRVSGRNLEVTGRRRWSLVVLDWVAAMVFAECAVTPVS